MKGNAALPRMAVFDLGGVVCRFLPGRRLAALATASALPAREVSKRLWDSGFDRDCDLGKYMAPEIHRRINGMLGCGLSYDALLDIWASAFETQSQVLQCVREFRGRAPTFLLTDNSDLLYRAMPSRFPEICDSFEELLFSAHLGGVKSAPQLFRGLSRRLNIPPHQIMLVDDSETALANAKSAGWQCFPFVSPTASLPALRKRLAIEWMGD